MSEVGALNKPQLSEQVLQVLAAQAGPYVVQAALVWKAEVGQLVGARASFRSVPGAAAVGPAARERPFRVGGS